MRQHPGELPRFVYLRYRFTESVFSGQKVAFTLVASTDPDIVAAGPDFSIPNPTKFSDSKSGSTSVSFDKSVTLFSDTLSCAGDDNANEDVTLTVGVDADVDLTATFTFQIAGTVIPPDVNTLLASAGKCTDNSYDKKWPDHFLAVIDGTFEGTLNFDADLTVGYTYTLLKLHI